MDGILRLVEREKEEIEEKSLRPPPDELGWEAKCIWMEAGKYLLDNDLLHSGNYDLFYIYCVLLGESKESANMIAVDGKIVGGKKHAAWDMMIQAADKAKNIYVVLNPNRKKEEIKEEVEEENVWKNSGLLA